MIAKIVSGGGFTFSVNELHTNGETLLTMAVEKGVKFYHFISIELKTVLHIIIRRDKRKPYCLLFYCYS